MAAETGLHSLAATPGPVWPTARMWIDANIDSFQRLLRPVTDKFGEKMTSGRLSSFTSRAGGIEVGLLLGWMSSRVLGQYDLLIIEDENPEDQDIVYYVGPNIMALEKKHAFPPEEFRLWIALHEVTHRAQFTGVPWLREHFLSLVERDARRRRPRPRDPQGRSEAHPRGTSRRRGPAGRRRACRRCWPRPNSARSSTAIVGDDEPARGPRRHHHGSGRRRPGSERRAVRRDAAGPPQLGTGISRVLQKVIGLEAKMNQYQAGESFIEAVEAAGGSELVDRAWERPENLPRWTRSAHPPVDRATRRHGGRHRRG